VQPLQLLNSLIHCINAGQKLNILEEQYDYYAFIKKLIPASVLFIVHMSSLQKEKTH
jgi:hypothetical protein